MKNLILTLLVIALFAVAAFYIYDNIRERTHEEKIAEIIHLEDSRDFSAKLISYTQDSVVSIRARAALAVGRIGAKGAGELLYRLVAEDVDDVASVAAFAIGLTGESKYTNPLADLAQTAPSRVAENIVASIGRLADSTSTGIHKELTSFLLHPSPEVRAQACYALFRANARTEATALIDFIEQEKDEEAQLAALYALSRMRVQDAYNTYVSFLADADPFVRSLALRGVGLSDNKGAIHYLTIALNDSDKNVVATAISILAGKEDDTSKKKLAALLPKTKDEKLLVDIINGLFRQNNQTALEDIRYILETNNSPNIISASIKYLAATEQDKAVMKIDSLMRNENRQIRAAAAEAFGIIGSKNNIPRLSILFSDSDPLVRMTAMSQLLDIDSTNLKFYLDQALADSNFVMRSVAIDEITTRKLIAYLPQLRNISMNAANLKSDIRRSLADCAGRFLSDNKNDTNALRILVNASLDKNYIVRKEAIAQYNDILGEDRSDMLRTVQTRFSTSQIEKAIKKYRVNPTATIITSKGQFDLELYFDVAPLTVMNFIDLAEKGFYDNLIFHRVISSFVAQGGDPEGTGWGGPGYMIRCEYSDVPYIRGTVGVATSGKDTGGSQFFIAHTPLPHLDARYTVFGQVIFGMDEVDKLVVGDTIKEILIQEGKQL
ncbi:MAG: hypothetical protein DWP97_03300 [Calditrichaeota bacterium]|nr:MAG: hypothetical protein DWP97_03300 [Calditrichota bacterium]